MRIRYSGAALAMEAMQQVGIRAQETRDSIDRFVRAAQPPPRDILERIDAAVEDAEGFIEWNPNEWTDPDAMDWRADATTEETSSA